MHSCRRMIRRGAHPARNHTGWGLNIAGPGPALRLLSPTAASLSARIALPSASSSIHLPSAGGTSGGTPSANRRVFTVLAPRTAACLRQAAACVGPGLGGVRGEAVEMDPPAGPAPRPCAVCPPHRSPHRPRRMRGVRPESPGRPGRLGFATGPGSGPWLLECASRAEGGVGRFTSRLMAALCCAMLARTTACGETSRVPEQFELSPWRGSLLTWESVAEATSV